MARLARLTLPGVAHLVVLRALDGCRIFMDDADRVAAGLALGEAGRAHAVAVHAYALGETQVCWLVTPSTATGLGAMMQSFGRHYVAGFNRRHGRSGTLWNGRYRSTVVGPSEVLGAMRFVEQSVWPDGSVDGSGPGAWAWSSAHHHLGQRRDALVSVHAAYWTLGNTPFERESAWRARLETPQPPRERQRLADHAWKGWPVGDGAFLAELSARTQRPVAARPRGRPRKSTP